MSHPDAGSTGTALQTTFLIPNLHCPSCVSSIESLLHELTPRPTLANISLIDHAVLVSHPRTLLAATISDHFAKSGYEVYDIFLDADSNERHPYGENDNANTAQDLDHAISRWLPQHLDVDEAAKQLHAEHCSACKEETEKTSKTSTLTTVIAKDPVTTLRSMKTTLSVEGMTCSACVGNVTNAIKELPWVSSANVNLIDHSAVVVFSAEQGQQSADMIAEAVEDVGYGATVEAVVESEPTKRPHLQKATSRWKALLAISGMTCSVCVGAIAEPLNKLPFVLSVEVNLISNSATVVFEGKENATNIVSCIEDVGYDAEVSEMRELESRVEDQNKSRSVAIKVEGMHCSRCPGRIQDALDELSVTVTKPLSIKDPIVYVTYIPTSPELNIRTIISKISAVDPSFVVKLYHPPTVEEKSRRMMAKERRRIFYRVLLSALAAIPTLIIGVIYMNLVSHQDSNYEYLNQLLMGVTRAEWATFILATPVYFLAADIFHRRTLKELYSLWRPGSKVPVLRRFYKFGSMNMLISFGTSISYFASLIELIITAAGRGKPQQDSSKAVYFDSVVFLTFFLLVGRLAEAHMKAKSGDAVAALGSLRPTEANLVRQTDAASDKAMETINVDLLDAGDQVKVFNGASPPCDGVIVEGDTQFDESSLTGESKMISKTVGDQVFSGTINKARPVIVRVTEISGSSMLDSIIQVVREGQAKRAPVERIADLLTGYFVPVIVFLAILTWIVWLALGTSGALPSDYLDGNSSWATWSLQFAIAVFVIACPCGLGLAAPTALFVGGGIAARRGILVKGGGEAFQEASNLDCVVFDKTGTLTEGGEPKITDYKVYEDENLSENHILGVALGIEENSSHPLAKAVCGFIRDKSPEKVGVTVVEEIPGRGMKAIVSVQLSEDFEFEIVIGNERLLIEHGVVLSPEAKEGVSLWQSQGKSVIMVAACPRDGGGNWRLNSVFAATDPLRTSAKTAISALRDMKIDVWMLSGDNETTAKAIAKQVNIPPTNVIAGVLPGEKANKIKYLQSSLGKPSLSKATDTRPQHQRAVVAMIGDGINDAPALATADVGIAIGSGSDVALSSASFILINSELGALLTLLHLSRAVFRRIKFNFGWAVVYNLIALPIAAGVLYPVRTGDGGHVRLDPVWASLAMALSSISVVGSSLLLRTRIWGVGFRERSM